MQPIDLKIAHHLHIPAQIIRAVQYKIPTLVLIRYPIDSVASFLLFNPALTVPVALKHYISFYRSVLPYIDGFLVATFYEATQHLDKVIANVNSHFKTCFNVPILDQSDIKEIYFNIDEYKSIYFLAIFSALNLITFCLADLLE